MSEYNIMLKKIKDDFGLEPLNEVWYPWPSVGYLIEQGKITTAEQKYIGIIVCKQLIDGSEKSFIGLGSGNDKTADIYSIIEKGVPFYGKIK